MQFIMQIKLIKYFLLGFLLFSISCSNNDEDGKSIDNIVLSTKSLSFPKSISTGLITTKGENWWFNIVKTNENEIHEDLFDKDIITGTWFTITRPDKKSILIDVQENLTNKSRSIDIELSSGNYYDHLKISQE
jgi:hypothetical protein